VIQNCASWGADSRSGDWEDWKKSGPGEGAEKVLGPGKTKAGVVDGT